MNISVMDYYSHNCDEMLYVFQNEFQSHNYYVLETNFMKEFSVSGKKQAVYFY